MTELLPCPFCGGEPVTNGGLVACRTTDCILCWKDIAFRIWNTRAVSPSEWHVPDKEQLMDKIVKIMTDFHGMNHRYAALAIADLLTPPNNHNREGA